MGPMKLAFSPCPNDTLFFHALVKNLIPHKFNLDVSLSDIQVLNQRAIDSIPDVSKVSFYTMGKVHHNYGLLPVGAALGYGNGPKIVSRVPHKIEDLRISTLAIPGRDTTAYLLYRLLLPHARVERFCRYDEIPQLLKKWADFGLIIHETRFNLKELGLYEICDLGELWEKKTGLPLPLGGIVARKNLGQQTLADLTQSLIASYDYAKANPDAAKDYMLEHCQEKDYEVLKSHVDLYVNDETRHLSDVGYRAIRLLMQEAQNAKLLPKFDINNLTF